MIFLTVGTEYPFDRLVREVDRLCGEGIMLPVFAQIGETEYAPQYMEFVRTVTRADYSQHVSCADAVISHAGMGTILACIDAKKPLVVVPRRKRYGEHVNDHQLATVRRFEGAGYFLVSETIDDLRTKIDGLPFFSPRPSGSNREDLIRTLRRFAAR